MKRPLSVTIIAGLLLLAGTVGLIFHATDFKSWHPFPYDLLGIELIRVLAVVAGIYMLRGSNWARWLGLLWIAFHVGVSIFDSWFAVFFHAALLGVFAWVLLRAPASAFFRAPKPA